MKSSTLLTDREYLKNDQYKDARNLRHRISLHERFSTNPVGWHTWVFDQFDLPVSAMILEIGCGPGRLWSKNRNRIRPTWKVFLSDLSSGMVSETRRSLQALRAFACLCFDAQDVPLPDASFDAVIANHMLYHVPDVQQALTAIHRVLKPSGKLYATTNGGTHLQEMAHYASLADQNTPSQYVSVFQRDAENFSLQSGRDQLVEFFQHVEKRDYPDSLRVTDAEAIVQFIQSMPVFGLSPTAITRLRQLLQQEIESKAAITISKESGIFIACKAGSP